jgi:hypothetical protein
MTCALAWFAHWRYSVAGAVDFQWEDSKGESSTITAEFAANYYFEPEPNDDDELLVADLIVTAGPYTHPLFSLT